MKHNLLSRVAVIILMTFWFFLASQNCLGCSKALAVWYKNWFVLSRDPATEQDGSPYDSPAPPAPPALALLLLPTVQLRLLPQPLWTRG